jgi:glycosyltransferase involved in cell wall biosynthesis
VAAAHVAGIEPDATDRPTTVVHLITTLGQGGAERALSLVVPGPEEAAAHGERHVVVSLAAGGMFVELIRERGIEVRDLGMRPGRDLLKGAVRLSCLLRELRPTHLIAWMYHAMFLADVVLLALPRRRARPRAAWMIQGSLHTTEGLPWHTRAIIALLARRSTSPDVIAINSETGREHHVHHGYAPRRWIAVPSGCDTTTFRPDEDDRRAVREELGIDPEAIVAISVARDHPQKDHPTMIAALERAHAEIDGLELILVGTRTERFAQDRRGGPRIHGLGERGDVARLLRGADIVLSSSITEGMPNALLEAMASGLPAVVTDVGDCRAAVGDAGHVVAAQDADALAGAILLLAALDPEERRALGERARAHIIAEFGIERAERAYREIWTGPRDGASR